LLAEDSVITAPRRFILLVVGIVLAAAAIMVPRRDEWLAMMRDENKQAQIIELLEPRLAESGNDVDLLATLGRSYAETGNNQRAIELLDRFIAIRPDDGEAYGRLADLYKRTGDTARQVVMLERSVAITPRLPRAVELAALYRERQQPELELALLSRFDADATLENGLLLRLAELRVGSGDRMGAIRTLERPEVISSWSPPNRNGEARLYLAELLVQSGQSLDVVRFGKNWILQWREPWLDDRLLHIVALRVPIADSSELADVVAALHPEVRFFLAHELMEMGARPLARHLLETWVSANPAPSMNEIAGFLSACRDQDAQDIVWHGFELVLRLPSSSEVIARFGEAIAAEFGIGALAPFWARYPEALTRRGSLLAARLAFQEQNLQVTKWLIEKADLVDLATSDRLIWINLLEAVASPSEAFRVLRERRQTGRLTADLLGQYVRLAGSLGDETEYRAALADMRGRSE
jgi:tetratricopeptide (TPR) repeat protein